MGMRRPIGAFSQIVQKIYSRDVKVDVNTALDNTQTASIILYSREIY